MSSPTTLGEMGESEMGLTPAQPESDPTTPRHQKVSIRKEQLNDPNAVFKTMLDRKQGLQEEEDRILQAMKHLSVTEELKTKLQTFVRSKFKDEEIVLRV